MGRKMENRSVNNIKEWMRTTKNKNKRKADQKKREWNEI